MATEIRKVTAPDVEFGTGNATSAGGHVGAKINASHIPVVLGNNALSLNDAVTAIYDARAYAVGDGTTNDAAGLQTAATAAAGGDLYLKKGRVFAIASAISLPSNIRVYGGGEIKLIGNSDVFVIDGKTNVTIEDIIINGNKATYTSVNNDGISSPANGVGSSNILIKDVYIRDMGGAGIAFLAQTGSHSKNIRILNTRVENVGTQGIIGQDYVDDFLALNCRVVNFGLAYADRPGITSGRSSKNSQVLGCYVESDGNSLGASSHGISIEGADGVASGNIVRGTVGYGIEVGLSSNVVVSGNEVSEGANYGIVLSGWESEGAANVVSVDGNIIKNCVGGIFAFVTDHSAVWVENISVRGNSIDSNDQVGIYFRDVRHATVSGNMISNNGQSGIYIHNSTEVDIIGNKHNNNNTNADAGHDANVRVIAGCVAIRINGYIARDSAGYATSGTGEDNLFTITIPRYYYKNYRGIRFTTAGTKSGAGGNKTIKFYWGGTAYIVHAAANNANDWRIYVEILYHGATFREMGGAGWDGSTPLQGYEDGVINMSAADTILKFTGECADAGDAIQQNQVLIEVF